MSHTAVVQARIDPATKAATERVLETLGMTPTEAIRLFFRQIALRREFPLERRVPNQLTASGLGKSGRNQEVETFASPSELYASWEK